MSRLADHQPSLITSFPRVSGDEPCAWGTVGGITMFSPRERG